MLSSLDFDSCIVLTHYCWVFWFMCMYILVIMIIRFYWLYYDYEYDYDSHVSVEKLLLHYSFFPWTMSCPITSLLIFGINYLDLVTLVAITLSYICVSELSWCWATGMLGCVVLLLCLGCLCFGFMHAPIPPCLWKYFWLQCCDVNFELTSPLMYMSLFIHNFIFIFCR